MENWWKEPGLIRSNEVCCYGVVQCIWNQLNSQCFIVRWENMFWQIWRDFAYFTIRIKNLDSSRYPESMAHHSNENLIDQLSSYKKQGDSQSYFNWYESLVTRSEKMHVVSCKFESKIILLSKKEHVTTT